MQTRLRSLCESITITILSIAYAVPLNYVLYTEVQWRSTWSMAFWITIWFTIIGIGFKYVIRRLFNWLDIMFPAETKIKLPEGVRSFILRFYP